ncbi:MAG: hypothetical protein ABSA46_09325 [Thermodesulfovibrionales bacterium]
MAVRVDEGYKRFFAARTEGKTTVHLPRFLEFKKCRSIAYSRYGTALGPISKPARFASPGWKDNI